MASSETDSVLTLIPLRRRSFLGRCARVPRLMLFHYRMGIPLGPSMRLIRVLFKSPLI